MHGEHELNERSYELGLRLEYEQLRLRNGWNEPTETRQLLRPGIDGHGRPELLWLGDGKLRHEQ